MAARSRRVPLRAALLTLVLGLVGLTVTAIAVVSAVTSARSVADLQQRYFRAASEASSARLRAYLEPALATLADIRTQALDGRVSLRDGKDAGRYLVGRLRHLPHLAWLSYSDDATGRFVGAWRRDDGALVLNRSDPEVDGGRPSEHVVSEDGTMAPLDRDLKGGYDPRTARWYQDALVAVGPRWTEPFLFNEGRMGITAALALRRAPDAKPDGVLTADYFLDGLARYLKEIAGDASTRIDVLTRAGASVACSAGAPSPDDLQKALDAAPHGIGTLALGDPVSWTYSEPQGARIAAMGAVATRDAGEWIVLVSVPEDHFLEGVRGNRRTALLLGGAVALLAIGLGWRLSRVLSDPLRRVTRDLERVARFELQPATGRASIVREVQVLHEAVERMKAGLRSFGRYVPTDLVRELMAAGREARLGGERRDLTVFFADVAGFTAIGERMDPTRLVDLLGRYFEAGCDAVQERGGTIDKFLGDGILAFFNAPRDVPRHAAHACRAALDLRARLEALAPTLAAEGHAPLRVRVGLHTGEAMVGNVGTPERFGYTAMGDTVNLAARLEGLNKRYGTTILASQETVDAAGPGYEWQRLDKVSVVGRAGGTVVSELLGLLGQVDPTRIESRDRYERALSLYFERRFAEATQAFEACGRSAGAAPAALLLRDRCRRLAESPPGPDWDGTDVATEK